NGRHIGHVEVPGEEYPGVLADLGDKGVDHVAALGLGVDGGEVGTGQHVADDAGGIAGVHQIIDDEELAAIARDVEDRPADFLEHLDAAPVLVVVAFDRYRLDGADIELAGDDGGRHQPAPGDRHHGVERAQPRQAPGQRAAIAVELIPGDGKRLLAGSVQHWSPCGRRPVTRENPSLAKRGAVANHSASGAITPAFACAAATIARTFSAASASRPSSAERSTSSVMTRPDPICG